MQMPSKPPMGGDACTDASGRHRAKGCISWTQVEVFLAMAEDALRAKSIANDVSRACVNLVDPVTSIRIQVRLAMTQAKSPPVTAVVVVILVLCVNECARMLRMGNGAIAFIICDI